MLGGAIRSRREVLAQALTPPGKRPPFREQLTRPAALDFWRRHRYSPIGAEILAQLTPESILELDQALATANEPTVPGMEVD